MIASPCNPIPQYYDANELFKNYGEFIRYVIRKLANHSADIDDIYQDFFLSTSINPLKITQGDIKAYLYRAISNQIIDYYRRDQRYRQVLDDFCNIKNKRYDYTFCALEQEEDQDRENRQIDQILAYMENHLPRCQSEAIIRRYRRKNDIKKIAQSMGVSRATVSKYISLGLRKIREIIEPGGDCLDETYC